MRTKAEHETAIIDIIKSNKVLFISHIFAYYHAITRQRFYQLELDKLDTIKDAIMENRESAKNYMLNKWIASDNATLQIAGFKLIADEEERRRLEQRQVDITSGQKPIEMSLDEAVALRKELDDKY